MKRRTITVICAIAVALSAGSALAQSSRAGTRPIAAENPPASAYQGYDFVLPAEKRVELARKIESLKLGDSVDHVIQILGQPDYDHAGDANMLFPREHRSRYVGYVFAQYRRNLVNMFKDQRVSLWFDSSGRLELVVSKYPGVTRRATADAMESGADWSKVFATKKPMTQPAATQPSTRPATQP